MRLFGFKEKRDEAPAPAAPEVTAAPVEAEAPAVPEAPVVVAPATPGVPRKYIFEADKRLLEKPHEPKHVFSAPARVSVWAEDEKTAAALAAKKLAELWAGTGVVPGTPVLVGCCAVPVDWSYGYDGEEKYGPTGDLVGRDVIR